MAPEMQVTPPELRLLGRDDSCAVADTLSSCERA